jgi:hypothetical protein
MIKLFSKGRSRWSPEPLKTLEGGKQYDPLTEPKERGDMFDLVEERVRDAKAIAWDTCHKIYLLMDDEQVELMRGYGYEPLITADEMTPTDMLETLKDWYENSCFLRFIDAVTTNHEDPNEGFETLIGQFEGEEDEDE